MEEEMVCSCCGNQRHVIRQEISRELAVVPAQFYVNVHVQDVCGCRHCESQGDGSRPVIVTAPKPNRAFPGSIASPSVVAHVMEPKFPEFITMRSGSSVHKFDVSCIF